MQDTTTSYRSIVTDALKNSVPYLLLVLALLLIAAVALEILIVTHQLGLPTAAVVERATPPEVDLWVWVPSIAVHTAVALAGIWMFVDRR